MRRPPGELVFLEQTGNLVSMLVWLAFGAVTILLSVLAHGLTAAPLATRYGRIAAGAESGDLSPEARARGASTARTSGPRARPKGSCP